MTANPARPVGRHRPGKAVQEEESSEEEDEVEEEAQQVPQPRSTTRTRPSAPTRAHVVARALSEEDDDDDEEGFVTDEDDENEAGLEIARSSKPTAPPSTIRTSLADGSQQVLQSIPQTQSGSESGSSEESEEVSEDEGSSSEEEAPQRKFQRPTFIKKTDRKLPTEQVGSVDQNTDIGNNHQKNGDRDTSQALEISSTALSASEQSRRLEEAEQLIKDKLERDAIARAAGRKAWDDDDDLLPEDLVDDTDGLDPAAEHSAWRLRELQRLKRDRAALVAREAEIAEVDRRRNLSAAEREAEDREYLSKQKAEREENRTQGKYLGKYHHRGAFFLDEADENAKRLMNRDFAGAKFADDVADKSTLPEFMRVRDMTKLGKKGRTRYTDLKGQDTGRFGDSVKRWRGSGYQDYGDRDGGMDMRGVDERFLPDRDGEGPRASGANASAVGIRKDRRRSKSRSRSPRRDRDDSYRSRRRRSYSRSRSRSRSFSYSRSPPPRSRRRRSPSPYYERDKRRRLET